MNSFYLVRHAHAEWTPDENRPLSNQGRQDAERVADILERYPIGLIHASAYFRAYQTITPLALRLDLPVHVEPELRERQLGDYPGEDFAAAVEATWKDPNFTHLGGEANVAAQGRGLRVMENLNKAYINEHIVLSTHGNLMALILQGFDPSIGYDFWKSLTMPDIYRLGFGYNSEVMIECLWGELGD
jgi:2,3-bisphosphoglycerate-dependent phosphoglycerate mutase